MESQVIFMDGMDNDPADFTNLQAFVQRSMDHVVGDGITSQRKYAGFQASAASAVSLAVNPGRFYSGGQVYNYPDNFTYDFTTGLPLATSRIATLVTWGEEVDTDVRPREFLINEETGASEPRPVAMEHDRAARLSVVLGNENADPSAPILDSGVTAVATITLTPAGIASVVMVADNALDSVQSVSDRTASLETFQAKANPQIVSLANDIASLTAGQANLVGKQDFSNALGRVELLEQQVGINTAAIASLSDSLVNAEKAATAAAGYSAAVAEGIGFPDNTNATTALQIFDGLNPRAKIVGGVMFPAYTNDLRLRVGPAAGEAGIASYTYQAHTLVQKMASRTRITVGSRQIPTLSSTFLLSGAYDVSRVFTANGEVFIEDASGNRTFVGNFASNRDNYYSVSTYEEPYWDTVTTTTTVNGCQIAQTFLQANDMWLPAVGITFTRLAATGDLTVAICETTNGMPDLSSVISTTTVTRDSLTLSGESVIPIQPVFLTGGKRYAILLITAADHWVATAAGDVYGDGTFFYVQDGQYQQGDGTRDVMFSLYAAKFASARAVIDMQPLALAGGITDIDILASAICPGSTELTYEIQIGSVWYPLNSSANAAILATVAAPPPLLPLRAVFTGSSDVMPALTLTGSQVIVSSGKAAFTFVGVAVPVPGSGSTQIRALVRLEQFDAAKHTLTANVRTGGTYATITAAASHTDTTNSDGTISRLFVFTLGAAVTSYELELDGATTDVRDPFKVGQIKTYAL